MFERTIKGVLLISIGSINQRTIKLLLFNTIKQPLNYRCPTQPNNGPQSKSKIVQNEWHIAQFQVLGETTFLANLYKNWLVQSWTTHPMVAIVSWDQIVSSTLTLTSWVETLTHLISSTSKDVQTSTYSIIEVVLKARTSTTIYEIWQTLTSDKIKSH